MFLVTVIEEISRKSEKYPGKQFPGAREEGAIFRNWSRRRGNKRGAGNISAGSHNKQRTRGFATGLPRNGQKPFNRKCRQQQDRQKRAPDHPSHGHMGKRHLAGPQKIVQAKVTDRLNHAGEHEPKRQNQCDAVMGAAEPHQSIGRVAETKERAANFEIKVDRGRTHNVGEARIQDRAKDQRQEQAIGDDWQPAPVLAEKPSDLCPIPQNNPQMPMKPGNRRECTYMTFWGKQALPATHCKLITYRRTGNEMLRLRQARDADRSGNRPLLKHYRSCIQIVSRRLSKADTNLYFVSL